MSEIPSSDPNLRVLSSEYALGVNADHVFGDEVTSRKKIVAAETVNRLIVERDETGSLKVYFIEPDGAAHE
jgi:hypothetical protein